MTSSMALVMRVRSSGSHAAALEFVAQTVGGTEQSSRCLRLMSRDCKSCVLLK